MDIVRENPKDGIILLATELSLADSIPFFKSGRPIVVLDGSLSDSQYDTVLINNYQGAYSGVKEWLQKNPELPTACFRLE